MFCIFLSSLLFPRTVCPVILPLSFPNNSLGCWNVYNVLLPVCVLIPFCFVCMWGVAARELIFFLSSPAVGLQWFTLWLCIAALLMDWNDWGKVQLYCQEPRSSLIRLQKLRSCRFNERSLEKNLIFSNWQKRDTFSGSLFTFKWKVSNRLF